MPLLRSFLKRVMDFAEHKSWEAYLEARDVPLKFGADASEAESDEAFQILGEANRHFYPKHLATLPAAIRQQIESGEHPSQSHERHEAASAVMAEFEHYLAENCSLPITEAPRMGFYHGDQIIFSVRFDSERPWAEIDDEIPPFYMGYRIFRTRQSEYERLNPPQGEQGGTPDP